MKTPGQVAYEAAYKNEPAHSWGLLTETQKRYWQAAAEAAVELGRKQGIEEAANLLDEGYASYGWLADEIRAALKDKEAPHA